MISYNEVLLLLEAFADGHKFRPRFYSEFREQLPNLSTEDLTFPIMFVEPLSGNTQENVGIIEFNVYCLDRIRKDRKNLNDVLSDTKQILSQDLTRWMEEGQQFVEVDRSYPAQAVNNYLLDYTAGWSMRLAVQVERISICEVPFDGSGLVPIQCEGGTVNVNQSNGSLIAAVTVASGAVEPYNVADGDIQINGVSTFSILAEGIKDIGLLDPDGNIIEVDSVTGDNLNIFLYWFQLAVLLFRNQLITDSATFETPEDATNKIIEIGETDYVNALQVITPNGYKAGFIYPIKGSENTDVDRLSTTTRFNEDGVLETLGNDVPMITFVNGGWATGGYLEETNLAEYSEPVNSSQLNVAANITFQSYAWDIGLATSIFYGDNSTTRLAYTGNAVVGNQYSMFSFVEMTDGSEPMIGDNGTDDIQAIIAGSTYFILITKYNIPNTNIWIIKALKTAGGSNANNGFLKRTFNSAKTFNLTGLMFLEGDVPINYPYIPTTGAIATRLEDVNTVTVPVGTTQITEYFTDGSTNVITTIPATHTYSKGLIRKIIFE